MILFSLLLVFLINNVNGMNSGNAGNDKPQKRKDYRGTSLPSNIKKLTQSKPKNKNDKNSIIQKTTEMYMKLYGGALSLTASMQNATDQDQYFNFFQFLFRENEAKINENIKALKESNQDVRSLKARLNRLKIDFKNI